MKKYTLKWNNNEDTSDSLPDLISIVLKEYIGDDSISYTFLEIQEHRDKGKIVIYFPTFMINEDDIDFEYDFYVNKDCIQFVIENSAEQTAKFLNHMSELLDQDDEITIKESEKTE